MTAKGIAPETCRAPRCGYLHENTVTIGGKSEPDHRCAHDVPMHPACAWHRTPEQIKAIEAQEQMTAQRVSEFFGKRGL